MKNYNFIISLMIASAVLFFAGCGCGKKTEREQYEDACSGIKYNGYKTLSKEVFPRLFDTYNGQAPDSLKVQVETGRLVLGYFWMCSGKSTFGFAEGNIITEDSDDAAFKSLAKLMIAIGMYENGWKDLAKEESASATSMLEKTPEGKYVKMEIMMLHLLMGTYAVYSKDFDAAKFHMAGFGSMSGINWPYMLVDGMGDIEKGDVQSGLKKIKAMSKDESVPMEVRVTLAEAIAKVEAQTGDVDSALFWPRAISLALYSEIKDAGQTGISEFMKLIDDVRSKVDVI